MAVAGAAEPPYSEAELLAIVRGERARSLGFDLDPELTVERERSLEYFKGVMRDVRALPNRSAVVSTDVSDAVLTVIPDLVEIFTAGDDVVTFAPVNEEDEEQAQQETDYVHHVVFGDENGFLTLLTMFLDACLSKTGVVKTWWEDAPEVQPETFTGKTLQEVMLAQQDGQVADLRPSKAEQDPEADPGQEPLYDFELLKEGPDGRICNRPIAPEDFTVARDTVRLQDTTYCAFRSRHRAQDLKAAGHDPKAIDRLPPYGIARDERVQLARDTAGEHLFPVGNDGPDRDHRRVEVVEHYMRLLSEDGKTLELWRIFTGGDEAILIDIEKVDRIPFSAITPIVVAHRFYGRSIADLLLEIQRIKTALTRAALDNAYFSLNQRYYVDVTKLDSFTLSDLLDNRPGVPVRGRGEGAVTPLMSAAAPYDYFQALEYVSTMGEGRTGIVRNAQGLNPDTLHDTASGQAALMSEAQKRVRFIARVFAETGVKDWFLNVHALVRKHASKAQILKLRGKWVPVDPSEWAERNEMTVELGVGSGGKQQRFAALMQVMTGQAKVAEVLGPNASRLVTPKNAYNALTDAAKALGLKQPDQYFTDPDTVPPSPPAPNPEMLKMQAQQQSEQAQRQNDLAMEQMKDQRESVALVQQHQREMAKIRAQARLESERLAFEREKDAADRKLKALQIAQDGENKREQLKTQLAVQASESRDAAEMARGDRAHEMGKEALGHLADHVAAERAASRPEAK